MSVVMVQFNSNVDNANGLPLAGPMNPYAVPNVSWKISNSTSATSSVSSVSHGRNRATKYPSSQDSSEYDSDGSRIHSSSYKSTSGTESASVQSFRSGSTETPTSATDSLDDDVPLIKQLKKGASPKKQLHSSTETDSSEDSSEGSTDDSDSSEGSQSESDSDESIDVPLGILASGTSTSFSSSNSNVPRPLSYQPPIASTGQQSNYQKYLMNQTNIYAQQNYSARTANPVRTSTPQSFVQSQSLSRSEQGARSNESLTATPKPKRKVLKEADSSEGSLSDESQPDII
jgi:hypothetical protein